MKDFIGALWFITTDMVLPFCKSAAKRLIFVYASSKLCRFCCQKLRHSHMPELEENDIQIYVCDPCQSEYIYSNEGALISLSIYTKIKERHYRWTVTSPDQAALWRVSFYPESNSKPAYGQHDYAKMIKSWKQDIPNISPSNIYQKVQTYLIFL